MEIGRTTLLAASVLGFAHMATAEGLTDMTVAEREAFRAEVRSYLIENFPNTNPQVKRMWMGSNEPGFVEFRLVGQTVCRESRCGEVAQCTLPRAVPQCPVLPFEVESEHQRLSDPGILEERRSTWTPTTRSSAMPC